ncbi:hypothetical protein B0H10DRAFT_1792713, partial [Mycena sp. CBHHK59/15]
NICFHFHKLLLSLVLSVFRDMFTLLQSVHIKDNKSCPVINIAEDSCMLEGMLGTPALEMFEEIQMVFEAAVKYDMVIIEKQVCNTLKVPKFIEQDLVRVYAIAIIYKQADLAHLAACDPLKLTMREWPSPKELKLISGAALQNLYDYYFACSREALMPIKILW